MKVKDIVTGNELESNNAVVISSWKLNPDRFIAVKIKKDDA